MNTKIAIITWHKYNNYGGVLQSFALRKKIKQLGYDKVDVIDYCPRASETKLSDVLNKKNIKEILLSKKHKNILSSIYQKFDEFRSDNMTFTENCELKTDLYKLNDKYDKFICGSDQIWAPKLFDENFFLGFVDNNDKKISYAPSIGLSIIEDELVKEEMKRLISSIPCLSIREEKGQEIIKKLTGRNAQIVLDPTLLLTKEEWNNEFDLDKFDIKNYILVYCLGDVSLAHKIAKKFKKKVIVIPKNYTDYDMYQQDTYLATPIEFLKLIYNADFVITDSFHGTIFSMNFNVPFLVLKRFKDNSNSQNSRIYSILKITNLEDRLYNSKMTLDNICTSIDFEALNNVLDVKRSESVNFLKKSIEKENDSKNEKNVITTLCSGCGACVAICPQKCISITLNKDGFFEYKKDNSKCTNCGLCKKVCAQIDNSKKKIENEKLYSFYSKDSKVLYNSSSGGFAYEVSKWGIINGYKIVGCIYDYKTNKAKHIIVDTEEELKQFAGSKYIQSYTKEAFEKILELEKAIIIGTPCQIASIDNLLKLKNRRKDFILIDLICHGVPSYLLWDKYLSEKEVVNNVRIRTKKFGWKNKSITTDGIHYKKESQDLFYDFFEAGNIYNESCYECQYRDSSSADIRIGDFWGTKFKDNNTGVSMVIVLSNIGQKVIENLKENEIGIVNEEDILNYFKYQQTKNVLMPYERRNILFDLRENKLSLEKISDKYCKQIKKEKRKMKNFKTLYSPLRKIYKIIRREGMNE